MRCRREEGQAVFSCSLGRFWELTWLFPLVVDFVGIHKGLVGDRVQLFVDFCSFRFQRSDLVESQS